MTEPIVLSRGTLTFRAHCVRRAKEPDADPLWQQIIDEMDRFTRGEDPEPQDGPDLFGGEQ